MRASFVSLMSLLLAMRMRALSMYQIEEYGVALLIVRR